VRGRASFTAAWVAAGRGLGDRLGDAQLAHDPYGLRFAGPAFLPIARVPILRARLAHWIAYMQVRTRAIDDELLGFVARGGRQVVILGAGYDARAARFARELDGVDLVEVDHPATQAEKRAKLPESRARYLPWNFEEHPAAELPDALALDRARPILVIWEGVTMYLTEGAIASTFAAMLELGARVVFTYLEARMLRRPHAVKSFLGAIGEPFVTGWEPQDLLRWLDARGWRLVSDRSDRELARELLPQEWARRVVGKGRHVAVADVLSQRA